MDDGKRRKLGAWYTPEHLSTPLVRRALEGLADHSVVVDLACGDGALLHAAGAVGDFRLVGFDIDPDAVEQARKRLPNAEIHVGNGLTEPIPAPDAILGNPPFLSGNDRPRFDTASFELASGQWDMAWLFVERGLALLRERGRFGFVLPDALLARHETQRVRDYFVRHASFLGIQHDEPAFAGAHVATVLIWGALGAQTPTLHMHRRTFSLDRSGIWPPLPNTPESWERLGDHVRISRGEELGKRNLLTVDSANKGVPLVSGNGVTDMAQAHATHLAPSNCLKKPDALFEGPKIVVVKTGRRLRAGIDFKELRTLQSVYNLQPNQRTEQWARCLCGLLLSDEVHRRFIAPYTSGKKIFPQITQRMLAQIQFPPPSQSTVTKMASAVARSDHDTINATARAWLGTGCEDGGVDL